MARHTGAPRPHPGTQYRWRSVLRRPGQVRVGLCASAGRWSTPHWTRSIPTMRTGPGLAPPPARRRGGLQLAQTGQVCVARLDACGATRCRTGHRWGSEPPAPQRATSAQEPLNWTTTARRLSRDRVLC